MIPYDKLHSVAVSWNTAINGYTVPLPFYITNNTPQLFPTYVRRKACEIYNGYERMEQAEQLCGTPHYSLQHMTEWCLVFNLLQNVFSFLCVNCSVVIHHLPTNWTDPPAADKSTQNWLRSLQGDATWLKPTTQRGTRRKLHWPRMFGRFLI